jgi:hypothetical protein
MPELMDGVGVGAVVLCLNDGDIGVVLDTFPWRSEAAVFWNKDGLCKSETVTKSNSHVFKILVEGKP